jgi:hypothetical protein
MFTALYYPHVKISSDLVKNALFLWDRVEYIAPWPDYEPFYDDRQLGEAVKVITGQHVPSEKVKHEANEAIIELLKQPLPDWFFVKDLPVENRYSLYPAKFCPETWELLQSKDLAVPIGDGFETSFPLGLTIMSILADTCAGTQRRLVTDEMASYSALDRYLATIGGAELGEFDEHSERLVTLTLRIMNFKDVDLLRLVELREKEKTASGAHIKALRHKYLKTIEEYSDKLSQTSNQQDAEEIERVFESEMEKDLNLLKDELKDEAKKVFFSAEMATALIGVAGSFFPSLVPPPAASVGLMVAGGALYRKKVEYRAARNKALTNHSMSWLYAMKKLPIY